MSSRYEYERTTGRDEVATLLRVLADGLAAGTVHLGRGEGAVEIEVPDEIELELEFETEAGDMEVEIEIEWMGTDLEKIRPATDALADSDEPIDDLPISSIGHPESKARFEVFRDRGEEWRWRLVHRNGNVLATGAEGYTRKHNALKGLRSVMRNAPLAEIVEESAE